MLAHLSVFIYLILNFNKLHACNSNTGQTSGTCGAKSSSAILPKIVDGNFAVPNSRPWLVSLRFNVNGKAIHSCGGSLIKENYVLTAAHCVEPVTNINDLTVVVGLHCTNSYSNSQVYQTEKMIIHPAYAGASGFILGSDIALIKLKTAVKLSATVSLINLPSANDVNKVIGQTVLVAGWGSLSSTFATEPKELQETSLKVGDGDSKCEQSMSKFPGINKGSLYCLYDALKVKANVCPGDSGSPFIYQSDGKWYAYGVVSFVERSLLTPVCSPTEPSYFTRVPLFVDWINQNMI